MLRIQELSRLRYDVESDGPMAVAAKAVLQAEAAHCQAAAEHEAARVTADPNERVRNMAAADVHRALADYCLSSASIPPRPKLDYGEGSTGLGEPASLHGPVGDGKPLEGDKVNDPKDVSPV
jgi:hypothetical protein